MTTKPTNSNQAPATACEAGSTPTPCGPPYQALLIAVETADAATLATTVQAAGLACTVVTNPVATQTALNPGNVDLLILACPHAVPPADTHALLRAVHTLRRKYASTDRGLPPLIAVIPSQDGASVAWARAGVSTCVAAPLTARRLRCAVCHVLEVERSRPQTTTPPINIHEALGRALGNRALVQKLVNQFICDLEQYVRDMQAALHSCDFAAVQQLAHKLKGGAANLAALRVRSQARLIESLARSENAVRLAEEIAALATEAEHLTRFAQTGLNAEQVADGCCATEGEHG